MFWSTDDRWLTIVVVVLHVGSNIHFDRLTFTAICRYSNTVKRFLFCFFKRWLDLQAPLALQMLSITFYFTFSVWVHLEKTSQRRHLFQHQQGGYLHLAPCSGDCSSPLENLDWILWQDPQSIRREKSEFRWNFFLNDLFNRVISSNILFWKAMHQAVKETLPGLHLDGSW